MKNRKMMGTFGIVLAIVLVFIIIWAVISGQNSDLAMSSEKAPEQQTSQADNSSGSSSPSASQAQDAPTPDSGMSSPNTAFNKYLREQDDILSDMIEDMMDEDPSGNASEDYLEAMIAHHEAAIDMAKNYLKYAGTTSKFEQTAGELINVQTKELQQMELLNDEIEDTMMNDEAKEREYLNTYHKILSEHPYTLAGSTSAADVDQSFIDTMTVHHQMAIDLSTAILDHTNHDDVRQLANQIIKETESFLLAF